jgi:methyl-accepting chemotaxis protein
MILVLRNIRRGLGGELELAISTAQRIAEGDLTARVPLASNDRSSLMHALAHMQSGLANAVARIRAGAENITSVRAKSRPATSTCRSAPSSRPRPSSRRLRAWIR